MRGNHLISYIRTYNVSSGSSDLVEMLAKATTTLRSTFTRSQYRRTIDRDAMELRDDFEEQFLASTDSNTSASDSDNDSAAESTHSEKESQLEPVQVQFKYHK